LFKIVPTTRLRENENISNEITSGNNLNINRGNSNTENTNNINSNNNILLRENSINEFSNFNLNVYSELTGANIDANSESGYNNRNFDSQLYEIFDNLTFLITTEKYEAFLFIFRNNLKTEKLNLQKAKNKFIEFKNHEMTKIDKEKEIWKENLKIVESLKCKETDILDLDIGGTHKITTTRSTLTKVYIFK